MAETVTKRPLKLESQFIPHKRLGRSGSPLEGEPNVPILQTYLNTFEYGPPELNLFRYVTNKASTLWRKAKEKCILKGSGKPMEWFFLMSEEDESIIQDSLKRFGFDKIQPEKISEAVLKEHKETVCLIYFAEQFWETMNPARVKKIRHVIRRASNSHIFLMTVSEREKIGAIECCKKYKFCPKPYVISPASDNTVFYETLYRILNRNLEVFSSDLDLRTSTRQIHAIKCELNSLIKKLQSRNTSDKSPLTEQCLEILEKSSKNGVVGYRLFENELHIYGNEQLTTEYEMTVKIESSIKEYFTGQVHFRSLEQILVPQCTLRCGDFIRNNTNDKMGTLGIFGEIKSKSNNKSVQTVALSSPHVISSGDIACSSTGVRFGKCIWPESGGNIHDVSIINIDSSMISSLQRTVFNERITIEDIPKENLYYRQVFKYGAATQKTCGLIEKIDHFQLFGSDVMAILPVDSEKPFSTNGDSGAVVLTIFNGKYHGVGVIYGGNLDARGAENKSTQNETIAIFMKNALDRFIRDRKMTIEFDKI